MSSTARPNWLVRIYQDAAHRRAWEARMLAALAAAPYTIPEALEFDRRIILGEIPEPRRFRAVQERQVLDWYGEYCYGCLATDVCLEIDHCVPYSHEDGLTVSTNGVPTCKSCNLWKSARPIDFRLPEYHASRWLPQAWASAASRCVGAA